MTETIESLSKEFYNKAWMGEDVYLFYEMVMENMRIWSFISFPPPFLGDAIEDLYRVVNLINEKYGFKERKLSGVNN